MFTELIFIIINLLVVGLAAWILYLQTDNKTKLLVVLIIMWAVVSAYKDIRSYTMNRPKPLLVLQHIEGQYDKEPPTAALFFLIVKNNGNVKATNISTHLIVSVGNVVLYDKTTKQEDIERHVDTQIRFRLKGDTFQKVWNKKTELVANLEISYFDSSGREYHGNFISKYEPHSNEPIFHPGWTIVKGEDWGTSSSK